MDIETEMERMRKFAWRVLWLGTLLIAFSLGGLFVLKFSSCG